MSKFIIRELAFWYTDEYYAHPKEGGIIEIFDNKEDADNHFRSLEIPKIRTLCFGTYSGPLNYGEHDPTGIREKLQNYFVKTFNISLLNEKGNYKYDYGEVYIPKEATDDQVWDIREIIGQKFYTLTEFKDESVFYTFSIDGRKYATNSNHYFMDEPDEDDEDYEDEDESFYPKIPYFYSTKQEAMKVAVEVLFYLRTHLEFEGSYHELSEMPIVLEKMVTNNSLAVYDSKNRLLDITIPEKDSDEVTNFFAILELLKNNPLQINTISLEEARSFGQKDYWVL